ncbi:MAG: glycosyltransferase family 2 protein [Planctomycetes bacterium]|nr:glycosyltransferase family 2 protein [Planctomycetota bacterium]MCB9911079.1 glycosyltransferase family 2 protein [Planctomycetota bacterium]MCB9912181.1 glycosyltransferase family 2 protein [Planctomycetota bacterium]HPF13103.1 glycosyltransferase family 2 protein [Planctomycetota bacterium]HRV81714.1 glycosyltransferase family 2 protein [Planctomycetota bacterium]
MPSRPRISFAIPVYNGMPYLVPAIESVLGQSLGDLELILADNASNDETEEVCRRYASEDARVRYFRHADNMGAAANFNFAVHVAQAPYFKWAAADDVCGADWARDSVEALDQAGEQAVLAFSHVLWIDAAGNPIESYGAGLPWSSGPPHERLRSLLANPVQSHLFKCSPICGVSRLKTLRTTELIGPFGGSDKVTLVEMALRGQWIEIPKPHFQRRVHERSSLAANKSPEDVARWFDPKRGGRYPMPRVTLFNAFLRAIQRAPLSRGERWRCLRVLVSFFRSEWRVLGGEYKIKVRERLGLRRGGRSG